MTSSAVLVANGSQPQNEKVLKILTEASKIVCIDGGYELIQKLNMTAQILIGDLDSVDLSKVKKETKIIRDSDQSTNDLEKALNYCLNEKITEISLIGATGGRDDQNLANILVAIDFISNLKIEILSDEYSINFSTNTQKFYCEPLTQISLISLDKNNIITTNGLKYDLVESKLFSSTHGISNSALKNEFTISSKMPLIVFKKL